MSKRVMLLLLFFFADVFPACAQGFVDMRAYGRQRGYRAASNKNVYVEPRTVQPAQASSVRERRPAAPKAAKTVEPVESVADEQSGTKMFTPEDFERIKKFKAKNPDFDNLPPDKKADILSRVNYN